MNLTVDDLTPQALAAFEDDYAARPGRESDGKKHQDRESVAYGWIAAMVRGKRWWYFRAEVRARMQPVEATR